MLRVLRVRGKKDKSGMGDEKDAGEERSGVESEMLQKRGDEWK